MVISFNLWDPQLCLVMSCQACTQRLSLPDSLFFLFSFLSFYSPQLLHPNGSHFRSLPSSFFSSFFFIYHLKSLTMTKKKKMVSSTSPIISLLLIQILTTPHNELRQLHLWIPPMKARIWVGFAMFLGLGLVLGFLCICVLVGLAFWLWVCLMVGFCVVVGGVYGCQLWVCRWWRWWSWVWMWVLSSPSRVTRVRKKKSNKKKSDLVTCGLHMLELKFSFCDEKNCIQTNCRLS